MGEMCGKPCQPEDANNSCWFSRSEEVVHVWYTDCPWFVDYIACMTLETKMSHYADFNAKANIFHGHASNFPCNKMFL